VRFLKKKMQMPMKDFFTLKFLVNFINPDHTINHISGDAEDEEQDNKVPDYCVENVMNFARSYRVADSKTAGKIEMMMN
jgi:hypothetical protein